MTDFLFQLCFASACSHHLITEQRLIRRSRSFVVTNPRRTTSPLSRLHRQRRWRCAQTPSPYRKKQRLSLSPSPSSLRRSNLLDSFVVAHSFVSGNAQDALALPLHNAIDQAAVQHLFGLSSSAMEASLPQPAPPPRCHIGSRAGADAQLEAAAPSTSDSLSSETMLPPPLPLACTPQGAVTPNAGAGAGASAVQPDDSLETRSSRSASTASRSNRLSLTLPIAPPTAFPTRPAPASSTVSSFPATPIDISSGLASPPEPADLITAIAAQERRVLEIREELSRAESSLTKLKRQWANHEAHKKRAEIRKTEPMRSLSSRPGTATAADSPETPVDDSTAKRNTELDRRKALLLGQQPDSDPNTPTQSRRRVFRGGHARTLSLLSPTKTSSDGFSVHEDQPDDESIKSPASSHEPDSPFLQNLGRYAPMTASQLSKRASWAPQSVHQVAGLKQVAGDLTATLWTFVEDLRQATVGDEIAGPNGAMRNIDANSRAVDDLQHTIRAPSNVSGRPQLSRAFTADLPGTPTPPPRNATATSASEQGASKEKTVSGSSRAKTNKSAKLADAKTAKRFSWTPLTVDSYDDSDWSSWDSPTVKSPRWSGSTANGDSVVASNPEQANENATPQKRESSLSSFSPSSPSASRTNDITWPAALNRLTPGNIKRTATDLMREWEKSLTPPMDMESADNGSVEGRSS